MRREQATTSQVAGTTWFNRVFLSSVAQVEMAEWETSGCHSPTETLRTSKNWQKHCYQSSPEERKRMAATGWMFNEEKVHLKAEHSLEAWLVPLSPDPHVDGPGSQCGSVLLLQESKVTPVCRDRACIFDPICLVVLRRSRCHRTFPAQRRQLNWLPYRKLPQSTQAMLLGQWNASFRNFNAVMRPGNCFLGQRGHWVSAQTR